MTLNAGINEEFNVWEAVTKQRVMKKKQNIKILFKCLVGDARGLMKRLNEG